MRLSKTVTGIECPICGDQIWSRHTHDMRYCSCEYCFVDGGRAYLRYGWGVAGVEYKVIPKKVIINLE